MTLQHPNSTAASDRARDSLSDAPDNPGGRTLDEGDLVLVEIIAVSAAFIAEALGDPPNRADALKAVLDRLPFHEIDQSLADLRECLK